MTDAAVLRLVISLIVVVLLILGIAWVSRKTGWLRPSSNQAIRVISMQNVGARAHIALIEIDQARLVLGITSNQISLLHTLPPSAEPPTDSIPEPGGFRRVLSNTLKRP